METQHRKTIKKALQLLFPVISTLFVLIISILIYYFSKGYRINIYDGEIKKTGVLTIKTDPSSANISIDGKDSGKTPKSRSIDIGNYKLSITKQDYRTWEKEIEIVEEKTTLLFPWLILQNNSKSKLWESDHTLVNHWTNKDHDNFTLLLKSPDQKLSLWTYRINTYLWDFNNNPMKIVDLNTQDISISPSPKGNYILLTNKKENKIYLLDTTKYNNITGTEILQDKDITTYSISWAEDSKHILLNSPETIISYDITKQIEKTILTKTPETGYVTATDQEGYIYILTESNEKTETNHIYTLTQYKLDGTTQKEIINKIYTQKDNNYINYYRENSYEPTLFTNSIETTQTVGEIKSLNVNQQAKGLIITTDQATYWYYIDSNKYIMISPFETNLIAISPDLRKALFQRENETTLFTITKDDADHTEQIGSQEIIPTNQYKDIYWITTSQHIYYHQDKTFKIADKEGTNTYEIINSDNLVSALVTSSRDNIITIETKTTGGLEISQYRIH